MELFLVDVQQAGHFHRLWCGIKHLFMHFNPSKTSLFVSRISTVWLLTASNHWTTFSSIQVVKPNMLESTWSIPRPQDNVILCADSSCNFTTCWVDGHQRQLALCMILVALSLVIDICLEITLHCAPVLILKCIFWWFIKSVSWQSGNLVVPHCTTSIKGSSEMSELHIMCNTVDFLLVLL